MVQLFVMMCMTMLLFLVITKCYQKGVVIINNKFVQIICITYKHEKFIAQALDSILMQKTNFQFEIIVSEDCSPDRTRDIVKLYQKRYPRIIKPIYQEQNVGAMANFRTALEAVSAKFVALCEGDDYWLDKFKLQKQVDALQNNSDCAVCCHPVMIRWEDKSHVDEIFPNREGFINKKIFTFEDLKRKNFIQTNSVMYRWGIFRKDLSALFPSDILPGDWLLHLLHATLGNILFLDDVMAVYRKWAGGLWAGAGASPAWFCACGIAHMNFFKHLEKVFPGKYKANEQDMISYTKNILLSALQLKRPDVIQDVIARYPNYASLFIKKGKPL